MNWHSNTTQFVIEWQRGGVQGTEHLRLLTKIAHFFLLFCGFHSHWTKRNPVKNFSEKFPNWCYFLPPYHKMRGCREVKTMDSRATLLGSESQLCCLLAEWPWSSLLISLCFSLLIYKIMTSWYCLRTKIKSLEEIITYNLDFINISYCYSQDFTIILQVLSLLGVNCCNYQKISKCRNIPIFSLGTTSLWAWKSKFSSHMCSVWLKNI